MTVIDHIYQEDKAPAGHPRILALANQKGGVGKTTTAINLGTALAAIGERVLIVDLDPQGNASTGLGIDRRNRNCSTYDVLIGEAPLRDAVVPTAVPRLHIAASTMDLSGLELELGSTRDRAYRLRDAIAALNTNATPDTDYTYVLIDCPPSLNLLTVNAMAASDAILVPLQCEFFALEGLSQLLQTVEQVRTTLNPNLSIHGIVLTMFDSRNNLSNQVVADVRQFMGSKVYNTMIPRNVRISEAPSYG
jgi:chromosome partitioning protein